MKSVHYLAVLVLLIFTISCDNQKDPSVNDSKTNVVSTTGMINDIVKNVAGDLVENRALMGPGVDPHLYKATARDVETLSEAEIIFYNGLLLEGKMIDIFETMERRGIKTVAVAESIPESKLMDSKDYPGNYDPHVWFDINLWKNAVEKVRQTLIEYDKENSGIYSSNAERYLGELEQLHGYVQEKVMSIPEEKRVMITAHDAFNYFGKGYGFEVIGIQGISTDTEASTSDIRKLADFIVDRQIPAIFIESSVSPKSIQALKAAASSKGHEVKIGGSLYSDAMGDPGTPEGTYIGMFRHNIDTISSALNGGK